MDEHALAFLEAAQSWDWPPVRRVQRSGQQGGSYKADTAKLLSGFIDASRAYPDSLLVSHFWDKVEGLDSRLVRNVRSLRRHLPMSADETVSMLFMGINRLTIDFQPIFYMAAELFTHLGIACTCYPGGSKSGVGAPHSVSEFVSQSTEGLLEAAAEEGFGQRKQQALKMLVFHRDGNNCVFTGSSFAPIDPDGVDPILGHIVPNSIHNTTDPLKAIAMFAGETVLALVMKELNSIGNVMNIEMNAHARYDKIEWAIQAVEDNDKVTYIFRKLVNPSVSGPGFIRLRDGDEIPFGIGKKEKLGGGPSPTLCNLQYAVARVLRMCGAADVIEQLKDDADDRDLSYIRPASTDFTTILTAKLLLNSAQLVF